MKSKAEESTNIIDLLKILDNLKHLKRTGWLRFDIPEPETVACHMYRMAMLAMLLDDNECDRVKCIRMALVHDLGEAIVGDITPFCGVSADEKYRLENEAMKEIAQMVPSAVGTDWYSLWCEYENGKTKEAMIVKHLDKFDLIAQAFQYEQKYGLDLEQFFVATKDKFTLEPFVSWDKELRAKRSALKGVVCENNIIPLQNGNME